MRLAIVALVAFASCRSKETAPASARTVKVAAIQCSSDLGAVTRNRAKLTALVEEAARNGAKIVVLPEAAVTGFLSQDLRTNWALPGRPLASMEGTRRESDCTTCR